MKSEAKGKKPYILISSSYSTQARTGRINQWTVSKRILFFKGKLVVIILVLLVMLRLEHKTWLSTLMHIVKLLFTKCNETKKYEEERGEKRDRKSFSSLFIFFNPLKFQPISPSGIPLLLRERHFKSVRT